MTIDYLIEDTEEILDAVRETKRIAVLGIKPESRLNQAAYYVPQYMKSQGFDIVPVPVYYPDVTEILGERVYRSLKEVPPPIDMINVFRKSNDIDQHVDEMIEASPKVVWFQLGIRNDEAARRLAEAGIRVIQDRCLMVEHRRLNRD